MKINIQIDKIVLEGLELSPSQVESLRATVGSALTRLAHEENAFSSVQGQSMRRFSTTQATIATGQPISEQLGQRVASSIIGGVNR